MIAQGVDYPEEKEPKVSGASTDFGNVSQVKPALSGYINIGDVVLHSPDGAKATGTPYANDVMIMGAKGLAYTAIDLLTKPELLEASVKEQNDRVQAQTNSLG